MTECNGCGRCCDPVVLPWTPQLLERTTGIIDDRTREWALHEIKLLPRREGLARTRGYIAQGGITTALVNGTAVTMFSHFYECQWYDPDTRTCGNYDNRPSVCRGFPWYDDPPDHRKAIPDECEYNLDVGRPVTIRSTHGT